MLKIRDLGVSIPLINNFLFLFLFFIHTHLPTFSVSSLPSFRTLFSFLPLPPPLSLSTNWPLSLTNFLKTFPKNTSVFSSAFLLQPFAFYFLYFWTKKVSDFPTDTLSLSLSPLWSINFFSFLVFFFFFSSIRIICFINLELNND